MIKYFVLCLLLLSVFAMPAISGPPAVLTSLTPVQWTLADGCSMPTLTIPQPIAITSASLPNYIDDLAVAKTTEQKGVYGETQAGFLVASSSPTMRQFVDDA